MPSIFEAAGLADAKPSLLLLSNGDKTELNMEMNFKIEAYAYALPEPVNSQDLEKKCAWPDGWAEKYTGVRRRHWCAEDQSNGDLGARASELALEKAGLSLADIDLLLFAGGTFDYVIPNQSSVIKAKLDSKCEVSIPCIDIDSTCLSFLSALEIAVEKLHLGKAKRILLVSAEVASKGINPENKETYALFGDAAVSMVLTASEGNSSLLKSNYSVYSAGLEDTIIKGGGNKMHFKNHPYRAEDYSFQMNGKSLLRLALNHIPTFVEDFFRDLQVGVSDLDVCIPHQASKAGLLLFDSVFSKWNSKMTVPSTLADYGNCIAASLPLTLALALERGQLKKGDLCFMIGTSAGFGIGATLIKL